MPLKDSGPPSRWHWQEAIAWIAFNIPDAGKSFTIRRAAELTGKSKDELLLRARKAVEELVSAVRDGKLETIWVGPRLDPFDGEPDDHFHVSPHEIEELMIDHLNGVINLSGCPVQGLYFNRANVVGEWPSDPAPPLISGTAGSDEVLTSRPTLQTEAAVDQAAEIEPAEETPEAVPGGLTKHARSKGGAQPKQNPWLLEAIQRIADMLPDDGIQPTSRAIWNWLCENAPSDRPYEFDPPIPGCDDLYVDGDELSFTDQAGNRQSRTRRSLERYRPRPKTHQG